MLTGLEGFILQELAQGRRLDFNLVSFYPRLSGALSSRDSDPEADGLFVRGAVKARRALVYGLKRSLEAENGLAVTRPRISNVFDKTANKHDVLAAGHELSAVGREFQIDLSHEDEGIWLEKETRKGTIKIARARVLKSSHINTTVLQPFTVVEEHVVRRIKECAAANPGLKFFLNGQEITVS